MRRDLIALPEDSRVWIYQADKKIKDTQLSSIQEEIIGFTKGWSSHGIELDCYGHVFHSYFIVLVADESKHVSGCSIDSSVHFIQNLGTKYNIDFFDRLNYLYFKDGDIARIHHTEFKNAIDRGDLNEDTLIFNNLVSSKEQFLDSWVTELKNSWHSRYL